MKTINYLFSVILSLSFLSCSNDGNLNNNNFSQSTLAFKALITSNSGSSAMSKVVQAVSTDTVLLFTGKNISWFNETTGELRFNNNFSLEKIGNGKVYLQVYSNNEPLYSVSFILTLNVMSYVINSPVIYNGVGENSSYIKNGYPERNLADLSKDDPWRIEREKNWNVLVQSEGWKLFIQQLKKEGRYRK